MADSKLSRAHVGLALASALVVLLASGVAISRVGDRDEDSSVSSSASTSPTGSIPAPSGSGPADASGTPAGVDQAPPATDVPATAAAAETPETPQGSTAKGIRRTPAGATGGSSLSGEDASASEGASEGSAASGDPGAGSADGGAKGGQEAPPQPSQDRPEDKALVAASVSAGEGAQGGVVAAAVTGTTPEADVTLGTSPVIGDHPPSEGTGINFGGRFLQPPPSAPVLG